MSPLWSGQGTVPHCTVSDLLSTDVLVSSPGAPVGAGKKTNDTFMQKLFLVHFTANSHDHQSAESSGHYNW